MPERDRAGEGRSTEGLLSLLLSLAHLVKSQRFFPPGHPSLAEQYAGCFRAWQQELLANGPLVLEVRPGHFVVGTTGETLVAREVDALAQELEQRGLRRLRLEPDLDMEAWQTLVQALATPAADLARAGGIERMLWPCAGLSTAGAAAAEAAEAPPTAAAESVSSREIEMDPLAAPASDHRATHLVEGLVELDECESDAGYDALVERLVAEAGALFGEGLRVECYRTLLVLTDHAGGKRSARQRAIAQQALERLAEGAVLTDVVGRASEPGSESLRAAQLLLAVGDAAVRPLFDALAAERDPERRGHLNGILITMGERVVPLLLDIFERGDVPRMRLAARLAGEVQCPGAVPRLADLLASEHASLRQEVAKALTRIGDGTALAALVEALESPLPDVPALAAHCLGASRSRDSLGPLLATLDRAVREGDGALAREAIRALGRLGRPGGAEALASILGRRSMFRRKSLLELKTAAAQALGSIPGETATAALRAAAAGGDARLRRIAQQALERRGSADATR